MATDWAAQIKKYAPGADEEVVANLVKTYRLALSDRDAALVAFTDADEVARVRESFLKKKLGLTLADDALDAAIAEVGTRMKDGSNNPRIAAYYLLAEKFNKLDVFK